ncbi:MAG: hypothetical protein ACYC27_19680 [Armatimonadota bacterium]
MISLLSDADMCEAALIIRMLITSSGQSAVLLRKDDTASLYGTDEGVFTEVCSFQLEMKDTPPLYIVKQNDAEASVLPELDVRVTDRIRFNSTDYRVQSVVEESLFGVMTHKTIKLVKLHGS